MHLKTDKVDLRKKPPQEFFLPFFANNSSSRHEKRGQMSKRFFAYFNALETYSVEDSIFRGTMLSSIFTKVP